MVPGPRLRYPLPRERALAQGGPLRQASGMPKNLILVHDPRYQSVGDMEAIRDGVGRLNPRVNATLAFNSLDNNRLKRRLGDFPTLVVSFTRLKTFRPDRGRILQGRTIPKTEQMSLLDRAGIPVPKIALVTPELQLSDPDWGEFIVRKPISPGFTSHGEGVELIRAASYRYQDPSTYPDGHPGRKSKMVVQRYIHTGRKPTSYRVLTLFGEPLYCVYSTYQPTDIRLDLPDDELRKLVIATNASDRQRELAAPADVLALARRIHEAVPDVPLKGIDIIREESTGTLYCLEFNPGGNTWHFSSSTSGARRDIGAFLGFPPEIADAKGREALLAQFNALETAARVLAEATESAAA